MNPVHNVFHQTAIKVAEKKANLTNAVFERLSNAKMVLTQNNKQCENYEKKNQKIYFDIQQVLIL